MDITKPETNPSLLKLGKMLAEHAKVAFLPVSACHGRDARLVLLV